MRTKALAALAALLLAGAAEAAVLTYAGYLQDAAGQPVKTTTTITFRFYDAEAAGTAVWEDTVTVLPSADGWFSAALGAGASPLDAALFAVPLWLTLQVSTDAAEMEPRMRVGSAPSALTVDWQGIQNKPATFPFDLTAVVQNQTATAQAASFRIGGSMRLGSEAGTSEPPGYPGGSAGGLVIRRVLSTTTFAGSVVARTDSLTLERDGTAGGLRVSKAGSASNEVATCAGITSTGASVGFHNGALPVGTTAIFTNAQNVVRADCMLGNPYGAGHVTHVRLMRTTADYYWVGTLESTHNQ